ncbi:MULTISPECIES: RusA family crossover junction endodeoxyribonuclease [Enterobacter cloacae complex]|uniref:RusA family crossover junction endodeoxyribonuclease n=1 Tax=Enterobacter cloacae complex TaxID=354276 RepID=UPI001938843E|nr:MULTISPECIES: RusA family crossover junction endodeoxyribonuclease [Enterobacter cloacae complex]MDU1107656.1 RusA family crossover junction endodeoxyribonuclease [Enterobacter sp.]EKT9985825.1 RusA family crossover junction endodeoxyribonuclease [Enterobacter ludwigii]MDU0845412.1 RusA family crossover junction endodeoxyribonuclease [Enterobacter asburiae]MDU0854179.1 RusA family crossover junction endodeoxyribonuclease [Enterobacter asburiae]MED5697742.1 RusA family crossover junction end
MKLVLPFPPSVNTYWRLQTKGPMKGRVLISEKGRAYKSNVRRAVIEQLQAMPKASSALADIDMVFYPPDYRERDLDNFNKAVLDALTYASVWVDDKQVKRMTLEWGEKVKGGKVEITIVEFKPRAGAAA